MRTGIDRFLLVRDNNQCCFGDLSKVNYFDQMAVQITSNHRVEDTLKILRMGGILEINEENLALGPGYPVFSLEGRLRRAVSVPAEPHAEISELPPAASLSLLLAVGVGGCDSPSTDASQCRPRRRSLSSPAAEAQAAARCQDRVLEAAGDREFDKTFDDLRFDIAVGEPFRREMLPESIEAFDGKPIRIRGFILPTPQKRGIKQFVLVRDNQECCFGPGAALFDCILVEMNEGETAEYTIRPVAVTGTFGIQEILGPDGKHLAIYHIAGETVK